MTTRGARAGLRARDGLLELFTLPDSGGRADDTLEIVVRHPIEHPTCIWVPHLTPAPGNVAGDWVFRAPAVVVADATLVVAFVVDVDDVKAARGWRAWLDYDHPTRSLTLAAGAYRVEGHVFFVREALHLPSSAEVSLRLHVMTSSRDEDLANPYGLAARFLWERWGHDGFARATTPPVTTHIERIVQWAFSSKGWGDSVWQEVDGSAEGGTARTRTDAQRAAPVFIVDVGRHPSVPPERRTWREPRSIWNQAWFSTQRCANGLLRLARQTGNVDLAERARKMTEVALSAPQTDGLFPAVLVADDRTWRWSNSDRRPASASSNACHVVDAAFTCRKLLEWHCLTGDERARGYVDRFVQRLVSLQRPSGGFPGWVEPDGSVPAELLEGPESAVATTLLFELGLREPALRGVGFLTEVAKAARWEDFETYYSCARWGAPGERVERNGVFKQNTLSIAWTAEAFLCAWKHTRDGGWLRLARRCIDELSLYQAVWDPPFLPAPGHGGFGVMNADAEWNDARQSLFAPLYLALSRETGDRDLLERGVSALRASFSMLYCPENAALARAYERRFPFFGPESFGFMMENQGHDLGEPIGAFTIFTWGNGSALEAVATIRDLFPDVARDYGFQ